MAAVCGEKVTVRDSRLRMFTCDRYGARLLPSACAKRYAADRIDFVLCRGCPVGEKNAKAERLATADRRVCARDGCDELFTGPPHQRYHSPRCSATVSSATKRKKRSVARDTGQPTAKQCEVCSSVIQAPAHAAAAGWLANRKYCSDSCRATAKRRKADARVGK